MLVVDVDVAVLLSLSLIILIVVVVVPVLVVLVDVVLIQSLNVIYDFCLHHCHSNCRLGDCSYCHFRVSPSTGLLSLWFCIGSVSSAI